ncbi:MAG: hypothetical protein IIU18_05350 [Oscillospiraceae bacterium]|nr:hypothetical protein [Oscillospiraceae bacterium]
MGIVIAVLAGLAWGALAAVLNRLINKKALEKSSTNALMAANIGRTAVDLAALGAVFLARGLLPFPYEPMLIAAAISLSLLTVVFAYRLAGSEKSAKKEE